jgi:hypothetical protein
MTRFVKHNCSPEIALPLIHTLREIWPWKRLERPLRHDRERWLGTDVTNLIQPIFKDIMN